MEDFQYVIPQFIDVEPRVIGPVTVRQFITVVVGGVLMAIEYGLFDIQLFIVMAFLTFGMTGIVGFIKVNGAPFHTFLLNLIASLRRPRIRVWRKEAGDFVVVREIAGKLLEEELVKKKGLPLSRLAELALIVNTGGMYKEEEQAYWRGEISQQ